MPTVVTLSQLHPDLTVEITSDEGLVDIVSAGYDAGVRLGGMIAQDMVAVRLTKPFAAIMVAAPAYLKARGVPRSVGELAVHNCIGYRLIASGAAYAWDLQEDGHDVTVHVNGTVRVSDALNALDLARAGVGIAYLFEPLARRDLRAGTLKQVLAAASIEEPGLFMYFPRYAAQAPKLRAFIEFHRSLQRRADR